MTAAHRRSLPPDIVEHARAFAAGRATPAEPRAAATVVLLRDSSGAPEVYLLRRVASMQFAARMHVFPGGSVDPRDADAALAWVGPPPSYWADVLDAAEPLARSLVCAAVRETFEESGVLLAGPLDDPTAVVADTTGAGWEADRLALIDRSLAFVDFLAGRGLALRADLLRPWSHWITPEVEERRFDTRFFVAALPPGQRTRDVGGEADRVTWMTARQALAEHARGELAMFPPTAVTLEELTPYADVAAVLAGAERRRIVPIMPRIVVDGDDVRLELSTGPELSPSPGTRAEPGPPA